MTAVRKVLITDTTFRDAHQSLLATRLRTEHMLEIAALMDRIGFHSMEVWGGATFDSCMRFLDEDPWERLRALRKAMPNTKLQMLLRGQNLLGYRHYPDDVVEVFVKKAVANGIDIIRIFDALNDVRNMAKALQATREAGAHAQAALAYTLSPVHDNDYFVRLGRELVELGADSLAIKDMAGLLSPYDAYELVTKLKELGVPVQLHCHYTSGMASMTYLKAIEAGVDIVDTACSALALGASQPPTESLVAALAGTQYDTGLSLDLLAEASAYFKEAKKAYDRPPDEALGVDTNVLSYQIPGGMISNLASQLASQNASHLLPQVLAEVPRVRKDLGYPPLVTPTSQIVGSQAVFNVLLGERYKMVSTEVKNYIRGLYGRPPAPVAAELQKKILGDEKPLDVRPADLLEPQMGKIPEEVKNLVESEEDLLSYLMFPQVAVSFFKRRRGLEPPLAAAGAAAAAAGAAKKAPKAEAKAAELSRLGAIDSSLMLEQDEIIVYPVA
ncbi:MAG: pyruvate carboxylase subunit B [Firmicutes bacterium]|nr:pyruvate carboxylase subunit B [Bacillota bacterium]